MTKLEDSEVLTVYDTWLNGYLNADIKTYDAYFDDALHFVGSTNNEEFLTRKESTNFFDATAQQLLGKSQLRNEIKIVEQFGKLVPIAHLFDAWFMNGIDWSFYNRLRFTNRLRKNKEGWRFIYQHYSTPYSKARILETSGYDPLNGENPQLRDALQRCTNELENKNRELEIEAALEKVRARTMAMQSSEELADEYLRLAYHGLRAKDKNFNADLITDFDESVGEISIIPQDIGGVILNLITNAFYAVNKKKQQDDNFKPIVSVSTKKTWDYLEIKVTDNGKGIPKEVVDKIFQPFFTTKPTGQGTGLGLSMSYDIVTKGHGGELKVETNEGEGTMFSVVLPIAGSAN